MLLILQYFCVYNTSFSVFYEQRTEEKMDTYYITYEIIMQDFRGDNDYDLVMSYHRTDICVPLYSSGLICEIGQSRIHVLHLGHRVPLLGQN